MEIVTEFFFKVRFRLNLCLGNWMIKLDKWADCSHFNADSRCGLWSGLQQLWTQPRQWSWVPRDCWSLRTMPRPTLQAPTSHSEKESQVGLLWAYPVFADLMLSHVRTYMWHKASCCVSQFPRGRHCCRRSRAQPPAPASQFTGKSTLEIS